MTEKGGIVVLDSQVLVRDTDFSRLALTWEQLAQLMGEQGDATTPAKLRQLAEKTRRAELNIAFCGHFSAGKSTMINTLLGVSLLPSNPIPTSANVVKIRGGEKAARVYTMNGDVVTFDPDTEMEKLKQFAVDGDTVESVEVSYPGTLLDEHSSLLDTPGIDSTDAAHKIATESALHLADVVIYMMDYNHVQAEENFNFTKTLKDRGKPVYLVVNMIDKHIDFELDFESYKESVEEAFATWNIHPDGIFYTSLAEPDHPENQYVELKQKLLSLIAGREELVAKSVRSAAEHLIEEHVQAVKASHAQTRQELENKLDSLNVADVDSRDAHAVAAALEQAQAIMQSLGNRTAEARAQMEKELGVLLDNARLTYYSTSEAAASYLESRKPGFKMGFLFAGKKTEEERQRREEALLAEFREKVAGNLDFHFKELMSKQLQAYELRDEDYHARVHATEIVITGEFLAKHIKDGAASREYVMNYCTDVASAIKLEYRRAGLAFIEEVTARLATNMQAESASQQERLDVLREMAAVHGQLASFTASEENTRERLQAIMREGEQES
ncbi:dynamin family protein [Brevibacillus sp. FSL K6-0770]|uniref:dynamin family protein n=1 Tax=Brevibacillus sp. 1238 TaxID=2940565 RepID=UPI002473662F|nr:dynamin family protein [Brevibacillus sp. 1238]